MNRFSKSLLVLLLAAFMSGPAASNAHAQSRYRLSPAVDIPAASIAAGSFMSSLFIEGSPAPQQPYSEINVIDSLIVSPYSGTVDKIGTISASALLLAPAVSVLGQLDSAETLTTYAVMYAEAFFLTVAVKDILKASVSRWRPWTYNNPESLGTDYYNSFPSGHTAYAFLGAGFLTSTFLTEYPENPYCGLVAGVSYGIAAVTAGLRIASGEHFITDVITGAAIGSAFGWFVPMLHLQPSYSLTDDVSLNISPSYVCLQISM